jgi:hypothetical protein
MTVLTAAFICSSFSMETVPILPVFESAVCGDNQRYLLIAVANDLSFWPFRTSGAPRGAVFIQQVEMYLPKELSV